MSNVTNLFRPIESPRYWNGPWAERWLKGTGNQPPNDMSEMVVKRYYKKEGHWKNQRV